jgi:HEAT repeat protein
MAKPRRQYDGGVSKGQREPPDTDVKKRAVFALSQLPKEEGIPLLIKVARTNQNPAVRKQAMFWLGQSKDPRALEFFAEVLSK